MDIRVPCKPYVMILLINSLVTRHRTSLNTVCAENMEV